MSSISEAEIKNNEEEEEEFNEEKEYEEEEYEMVENMYIRSLKLSDFKKEEFISKGTYKITELKTNKYYTAQILKNNLITSKNIPDVIAILSQLSHPSIVQYFGYSPFDFERNYNPVIITEFYRNGTLDQILNFESKGIKIEGWNMTTKLINIYGIAAAMSYLHSHDIIHRDINPHNIFVDNSLFPKLGGFDFSIKFSDIKDKELVGTPSYLAPEIYKDQIYSKASDVYAFGITVFEILTGSFAFEDLEYLQIMFRISIQKERPEFKKPIPKIYKDLIEKCWDENPEKRPSFEEIVNRIKNEKEFFTNDVDENMCRLFIELIGNEVGRIMLTGMKKMIINENQQVVIYNQCFPFVYNKQPSINNDEKKLQIIEALSKEAEINLNQFIIIENFRFSLFKIMHKSSRIIFVAKVLINTSNNTLLITESDGTVNIPYEIVILSQLSHPSIINYIGCSPFDFEEGNNPVIITEFYPNGTLDRILNFESKGIKIEGWNMTSKLINIYGIAAAISYLHSHDIIHRDIKPHNIFVDDYFFPKLGGFDIAIKLSDINDNEKAYGTSSYIAPEIYKDQIYSKASDVYAFGITVFEILTGSFAFDNKLSCSIMYRVAVKKERPKFTKPIPKIYKDLIEQCWDEDPKKRPSFEEIVNRLKYEKLFITNDVDEFMYRSYIDFIGNKVKAIGSTEKPKPIVPEDQQESIYRNLQFNINNDRKIDENEKKEILESLPKESKLDLNQFDRIGKDKEIGHGGFGSVFRIKHKETKKIYAAKTLFDKKNENIFLRELKILSDVKHPAIVKFVGYSLVDFNKDPCFVIVTEYMHNRSLDILLNEKPEYLTNTIKLINIYGIASAIDYLHSSSFLHLDINPKNVLENVFLFPIVCDFGLSLKMLNNQEIKPNSLGTALFKAPEKIKKGESTKEVDVYAFGMLLHEMKTTKHPFKDRTDINIEYLIRENLIINKIDKTIPAAYLELIKSCLNIDPSKRKPIKDIVEMLRTNREFLEDDVDEDLYRKYISMIDEELKGIDTTSEIKKTFKSYTILFKKDRSTSSMSETDDSSSDYME